MRVIRTGGLKFAVFGPNSDTTRITHQLTLVPSVFLLPSDARDDTGAQLYRSADVLCRLLTALLVPRSSFLYVLSVRQLPLSSCPEVAGLA